MKRIASAVIFLGAAFGLTAAAVADGSYQTLPFSQNWTNTGLITVDDDWSGVAGILGYRGDNLTSVSGADPQTILVDGTTTPVDINANKTDPLTFFSGGLTEFELADPTVAAFGSGTADAPFMLIHINSSGRMTIRVQYDLRDIEAGTDDAVSQFALHYRVGTTGDFTNVAAGYVADASGGTTATLVTPVDVVLPSNADNQAQLQIRIMTTNAAGNDEAIGIDNLSITGDETVGVEAETWSIVKSLFR